MKLSYRAVTREGKSLKGVIEAKDINEAGTYLRNRQLLPIKIKPYDEKKIDILSSFNKFKESDLVFFTRQVSSMLVSGLTLMQSLNILKEQIQNPAVKVVVESIISDVESGKSFSSAISKYPQVFSLIYISLIKAAEESGLLDKVLLRLADNLEKQQKLKSSVKSALMYPAIVVLGMFGVMTIMMIFVVPQLSILYESLNIDMPLPTQIIIGISKFLILFWPLIIGFFVIFVTSYGKWRNTKTGRGIIDKLKLKIPIIGKLTKEIILAEFTRTSGLLIGSGTLVVEALNQTAGIAGNIYYKEAIFGVAKRVEKGMTVGDSMMYSPFFPPILVQMSRIGEQTGKLDESLLKVSEYFEREVDQTIKTLMTALEPLIMIVLGVGVAFLIISIITPIYNLTSAIK